MQIENQIASRRWRSGRANSNHIPGGTGVSSAAFRAQSPGLRFASLLDMDFAVSGPLVRRSRLVPGFCPSTRAFARCFLQTPPRGDSPCTLLALHLHQVERRTFTSKLLSMPSTPLNRYAVTRRSEQWLANREGPPSTSLMGAGLGART